VLCFAIPFACSSSQRRDKNYGTNEGSDYQPEAGVFTGSGDGGDGDLDSEADSDDAASHDDQVSTDTALEPDAEPDAAVEVDATSEADPNTVP
jgi:hypothetical protein